MHIDPTSARPLQPHVAAAPAPRPTPAAAPAGPTDRAQFRVPAPAARAELSPGIPADVPEEVLAEIDAAARAYEELRTRGRELRFSNDARSGQLVIEVRDLDGRVLQRIPPTEALAVASGSFR